MPTKLIHSLKQLSAKEQGCVITIGNFDGVHLGHQQLVAAVVKEAAKRHVPSMVVTFEPHAFEFFSGDHLTIPRLTRCREKYFFLAQCGIDYILILNFNQQLADTTASDFIYKIIHETIHPVAIIVGDDFRFGHKRLGDFALLMQMGKELGFAVSAMETVFIDGERVSSTMVRKALSEGDLIRAKRFLGHPYYMLGRIRYGDRLGRQLGFPTANIYLHRRLTPVKGIYIVYVHGIADQPWPGVANVGIRPTIGGTKTLLEVHLLDFFQEIYGRYVQIEFCKKIRDEERFPHLERLKEAIAEDVLYARDYFRGCVNE